MLTILSGATTFIQAETAAILPTNVSAPSMQMSS